MGSFDGAVDPNIRSFGQFKDFAARTLDPQRQYRALTDHNQIAANMDERIYEGLIVRFSPAYAVARRDLLAEQSERGGTYSFDWWLIDMT